MRFSPEGIAEVEPVTPHARDEFGTLKTAIVCAFGSAKMFSRVYGGSAEDAQAMMRSSLAPSDAGAHAELLETLDRRGVRLVHPHPPNTPLTTDTVTRWVGDDIYTRDFLGVVDEMAILTKVIHFRNHNRVRYETILRAIPKTNQATLESGAFSWGNALLHGDAVLTSLPHHDYFTDIAPHVTADCLHEELTVFQDKAAGIRGMDALLRESGSVRKLLTIPMNSNGDLDCAIAPLPRRQRTDPRRVLLMAPEFHTDAEGLLRSQFDELIPVQDSLQTLPCNLLWLDPETPIIATEARRTRILLRLLGFNPIVLPLGSLVEQNHTGSGEAGSPGGWRCMTGTLVRADDYMGG